MFTGRSTKRTQRTIHLLHLYLRFLAVPPPRYLPAFPPPPGSPLRMGLLMRSSLSPWTPKRCCSLKVMLYSKDKQKLQDSAMCDLPSRICVPVSVFGDGELAHLSPPKSAASQLCDSAPCQVLLPAEPLRGSSTSRPVRHTHLLRTTQSDGAADPGSDCFQDIRRQEGHSHHLSSEKNDAIPRIFLEADAHNAHPSDRYHLGAKERTQTSPSAALPRLRNAGLKDGRSSKMTWVGLTRRGPPGLLVNGSKPPALPSQRQHTFVIKGLKQERGKRKDLAAAAAAAGGGMNGAKKNSVQLRSSLQRQVGDLNLPLLPAPLQGKTDRKNQLHSTDI